MGSKVARAETAFEKVWVWGKSKSYHILIFGASLVLFAFYIKKKDNGSDDKKKKQDEPTKSLPYQTPHQTPVTDEISEKKRSDELGDKYVMDRNLSVSFWYELKRRFLDIKCGKLEIQDLRLLKNTVLDLISKPVKDQLDSFLSNTLNLVKSDDYHLKEFESMVTEFSDRLHQQFSVCLKEILQDFAIPSEEFDQLVHEHPQTHLEPKNTNLHWEIVNTSLAKSSIMLSTHFNQDAELSGYISKAVECLKAYTDEPANRIQNSLTKAYYAFAAAAVQLSEPCQIPLILGFLAPSPDASTTVQQSYEQFAQLLQSQSEDLPTAC